MPGVMRFQQGAARRVRAGVEKVLAPSLDKLGVAAELPQSSLHNDYLRGIDAAIAAEELADLVLLNPPEPVKTGAVFAARYPDARIHVLGFVALPPLPMSTNRPNLTLRACDGIDGVHAYLTTIAPPQVLIDSCTGPRRKTAALRELLFHLADGGLYVIESLHAMAAVIEQGGARIDVLQELARLLVIRASREPRVTKRVSEHDIARARALGDIDWREDVIHIRKRGRHLLKLRDDEADAVLTARRGSRWGRQLARLPAETFRSRATATSNDPTRSFNPVMKVPELYLREYRDVVCAPRQLTIHDDFVLPISFHHRLHPTLLNRSFSQRDESQWFISTDGLLDTAPRLPGVYYHLDNEFPWHFGHFMTEDIGRLWGWPTAKSRYPDLKVLFSTWDPKTRSPGAGPTRHQLTVLAAYGIAAQDVVCIDKPVTVDVLIGASQMLYNHNPLYIHPAVADTWDRLRAALRTVPPQRPDPPRRLFVTRDPELNRSCRNAAEVEKLFESNGYQIVRPELLDIPAQVDLFAGADVVAGFGGSGMFNMMYCDNPGKRIVIAPYSYTARNEYLLSSVRGDDYHHFFCPSDIAHPPGGWSRKAFFSSFSFDFERDGAALEQTLRE